MSEETSGERGLEGRVALVTGASSGLAFARALRACVAQAHCGSN